mgnify:CR=1 FL=1
MNKHEALQELETEMIQNETLPLSGEANLVFGEGNINSDIIFIGEAPGQREDELKRPFVGRSGQLLDQLINKIGWQREDVYITNIVKRRPPDNRDPLPEELETYSKYLDREIEVIQPKVIVTLGRFSMGKFLPTARISGVHGKKFVVKWKDKDLVIVPMYHPAAALRNGEVMRQIREDFLKLPSILEEMKNKEDEVGQLKTEQMKLV